MYDGTLVDGIPTLSRGLYELILIGPLSFGGESECTLHCQIGEAVMRLCSSERRCTQNIYLYKRLMVGYEKIKFKLVWNTNDQKIRVKEIKS